MLLQCTKQASLVTKTLCAKVKIIIYLFCNTAGHKYGREEREIEIYYLFIVCMLRMYRLLSIPILGGLWSFTPVLLILKL